MSVDTKLGETQLGMGAANGAAKSNGTATPVVAEGTTRTKRTSSLMRAASSLPKVEHSLEEFIARANQTLVDVSGWGNADQQAREEEEKRREQDAQRWKQAEQQMRESQAREASLRRQLDGLQGKLAEAEARVAVALSASGSIPVANPDQDRAIEELRTQIEQANQRLKASEDRSTELSQALEAAKSEAAARPAFAVGSTVDADAEERIRQAEAKAAKALAAARAAAAGLTVSSADLAAIESGLVVPVAAERRTPWIPILLAFAGGLAIMFVIWKFALGPSKPAQQPAAEPPAAGAPAAPSTPSVTPIEEPATPQPAAADEDRSGPTVTPIEPDPTAATAEPEPAKAEPEPAKAEPEPAKAEPEPAKAEPEPAKAEPVKRPAVKRPARRPARRPVRRNPPKKPAKPTLQDPFATPSKPAPKKPAKPAGGLVDPF